LDLAIFSVSFGLPGLFFPVFIYSEGGAVYTRVIYFCSARFYI
jgi:hypothetical protein